MKQIPVTFRLEKKLFALVDDEDYEFLSKFNWCISDEHSFPLYAIACVDGKHVRMQNLVLPNDNPLLTVDHKNRNGLDNQKFNLRLATKRQQAANRKKKSNSKSKFKGVSWDVKANKWMAQICKSGSTRTLGRFVNEVDAAKAYNKAAIAEYGEFAHLNEFDEPLTETELKQGEI